MVNKIYESNIIKGWPIMNKLNVGIMNFEAFRQRTIAIAKGEYKPKKNEPKIWFNSIRAFSEVLCSENLTLLSIIDEMKPETIKELVQYTGRAQSNLSRTLRTLEKYNIVGLEKIKTTIRPTAKVTKFHLDIDASNFRSHAIKNDKFKKT